MAVIELTTAPTETSIDLSTDIAYFNDVSESPDAINQALMWRLSQVKGSDIASAATLNFDTSVGDVVDVTGTTSVTAITLTEGRKMTVRFTAILTLTNGASLVLPTGADIATAAGDYAVFRGYAAGVVRCVSYTRATGAALAGSGGASIGGTVTGGTEGSVLFLGAAGVLAQNNSKFFWDNTSNKENLQITSGGDSDTGALYAANILFDGYRGLRVRSTNATAYTPTHLRIENAAYTKMATIACGSSHGLNFDAQTPALWQFSSTASSGGASTVQINTGASALADAILNVNTGYATQVGQIIKLAATQSANAFEVQPNGSSTPLLSILAAGAMEMQEQTAPAAPSTNFVRLYAEDNGGGKTRLMARFATGAAVQIAIEP